MTDQSNHDVAAALAAVAPQADRLIMVCPICGHENLQGDDLCANCGADLRTSDIPQATTPFERLLVNVRLRDLETRPPFTVLADDSVATVLRQMRDAETADVLVLADGNLVGIFTERDAALKLIGSNIAPIDLVATPISDVMTHDPVVLRADDSVAVAIQKMAIGGFRHIPLVDDGRPIGVVSAADVFRHIMQIID